MAQFAIEVLPILKACQEAIEQDREMEIDPAIVLYMLVTLLTIHEEQGDTPTLAMLNMQPGRLN